MGKSSSKQKKGDATRKNEYRYVSADRLEHGYSFAPNRPDKSEGECNYLSGRIDNAYQHLEFHRENYSFASERSSTPERNCMTTSSIYGGIGYMYDGGLGRENSSTGNHTLTADAIDGGGYSEVPKRDRPLADREPPAETIVIDPGTSGVLAPQNSDVRVIFPTGCSPLVSHSIQLKVHTKFEQFIDHAPWMEDEWFIGPVPELTILNTETYLSRPFSSHVCILVPHCVEKRHLADIRVRYSKPESSKYGQVIRKLDKPETYIPTAKSDPDECFIVTDNYVWIYTRHFTQFICTCEKKSSSDLKGFLFGSHGHVTGEQEVNLRLYLCKPIYKIKDFAQELVNLEKMHSVQRRLLDSFDVTMPYEDLTDEDRIDVKISPRKSNGSWKSPTVASRGLYGDYDLIQTLRFERLKLCDSCHSLSPWEPREVTRKLVHPCEDGATEEQFRGVCSVEVFKQGSAFPVATTTNHFTIDLSSRHNSQVEVGIPSPQPVRFTFQEIANNLDGDHMSCFARSLGLTEVQLQEIVYNYPRNLNEQKMQIMIVWERMVGKSASVEKLIAALMKLNPPPMDIVGELRKFIPTPVHSPQQTQVTTDPPSLRTPPNQGRRPKRGRMTQGPSRFPPSGMSQEAEAPPQAPGLIVPTLTPTQNCSPAQELGYYEEEEEASAMSVQGAVAGALRSPRPAPRQVRFHAYEGRFSETMYPEPVYFVREAGTEEGPDQTEPKSAAVTNRSALPVDVTTGAVMQPSQPLNRSEQFNTPGPPEWNNQDHTDTTTTTTPPEEQGTSGGYPSGDPEIGEVFEVRDLREDADGDESYGYIPKVKVNIKVDVKPDVELLIIGDQTLVKLKSEMFPTINSFVHVIDSDEAVEGVEVVRKLPLFPNLKAVICQCALAFIPASNEDVDDTKALGNFERNLKDTVTFIKHSYPKVTVFISAVLPSINNEFQIATHNCNRKYLRNVAMDTGAFFINLTRFVCKPSGNPEPFFYLDGCQDGFTLSKKGAFKIAMEITKVFDLCSVGDQVEDVKAVKKLEHNDVDETDEMKPRKENEKGVVDPVDITAGVELLAIADETLAELQAEMLGNINNFITVLKVRGGSQGVEEVKKLHYIPNLKAVVFHCALAFYLDGN